MKIGKPKKVLDPYDWLPGFGESRIELRRGDKLDLNLDVVYESDGGVEKKRTIIFKSAWAYFWGGSRLG